MNTQSLADLLNHVLTMSVANPPDLVVEDGSVILKGTPFVVKSYIADVWNTIGTRKVPRVYVLEADGEEDSTELYHSVEVYKIAVKVAGEYAEWRARNALDDFVSEVVKCEQQALLDAYNEGRADAVDGRENPYPNDTKHAEEWARGYKDAQDESIF